MQFVNYLRPVQFVTHVCILNDRLKLLDEMIMKLRFLSEKPDAPFGPVKSMKTRIYEMTEDYRSVFGKIWMQHRTLNDCFGFSLVSITLNTFLNITSAFYFSIRENAEKFSLEFITQPIFHTFHIIILFAITIKTCEKSDELVRRSVFGQS